MSVHFGMQMEGQIKIEAKNFNQALGLFYFFTLLRNWQRKLNIKLFNIDFINLQIYYQNIVYTGLITSFTQTKLYKSMK